MLETKTKIELPVPLTQESKAKIGEQMAKTELLINQREANKKAITNKMSEEIKDLEAELYGLAKQFENNATNAEVECEVKFNTPQQRQKTIIRLDTNEVVKVYDMSEAEVREFEPELFDQPKQEENLFDSVKRIYGVELDYLMPEEDYEGNTYIVNDSSSLEEHETDAENIDPEVLNELMGSLAVKATFADIENLEANTEGVSHFFTAEESAEEVDWFFFKKLEPAITDNEISSDEEKEGLSEYAIPENVEEDKN